MNRPNKSPFVFRRRVEFADTDMAGIVHFASIFRFMEEAEHAFLRSLGLSVFTERDGSVISWPRLSAKCDFQSPIRFEDHVDIEVRVALLKRKTVTYAFVASVEDRQVATGEMVVVCCDVRHSEPLRAREIPADIAAKLGA